MTALPAADQDRRAVLSTNAPWLRLTSPVYPLALSWLPMYWSMDGPPATSFAVLLPAD